MDVFWELVQVTIYLDAVAFVVVFAVGMLVAPVIILMDGASWWKHRLKWVTLALFSSWFGLWMHRRRRPGAAAPPPARAAFNSQ